MSVLSRIRIYFQSRNLKYKLDLIRRYYSFSLKKERIPNLIISCLDNRISSVGFADRLKGMISCYAFAKAINTPFRIEHISPFDLSDYLVPSHYDWQLKPGEKSYNLLYASPVCFVQNILGYHSLKFFRINKSRQNHLFTNTNYLKDINEKYKKNYQFDELFSELFKPSATLEDEISEQEKELKSSGGYVSVSFRFMQLMGDFKDSYGDVLSENKRIELIDKSLSVIQELYEKEKKKILVTSDSQVFLNEAAKMSHVYVVPGKIGHIGFSNESEVYMKMFVDFMLISKADHVYMAHSGKMYRSNFARTAAISAGIPFDVISY